MQSYVEEQGPFNVIGVYRAEFDKRTVKILSPNNSLAYAQHMVELIKGELATKQICGEGGKVMIDAYLEPAGCPRPLSPELQAMMDRETARRTVEDIAHNKTAERVAYMRGELARMRAGARV